MLRLDSVKATSLFGISAFAALSGIAGSQRLSHTAPALAGNIFLPPPPTGEPNSFIGFGALVSLQNSILGAQIESKLRGEKTALVYTGSSSALLDWLRAALARLHWGVLGYGNPKASQAWKELIRRRVIEENQPTEAIAHSAASSALYQALLELKNEYTNNKAALDHLKKNLSVQFWGSPENHRALSRLKPTLKNLLIWDREGDYVAAIGQQRFLPMGLIAALGRRLSGENQHAILKYLLDQANGRSKAGSKPVTDLLGLMLWQPQ